MNHCTQMKPTGGARSRSGTAHSLCDVLDRVLAHGAVASGEVTLSLAGVDLVYLNLKLLVASSAKLLAVGDETRKMVSPTCN